MPTPSQIAAVKKAASEDPFFIVHEVVECVSEGEEGFGEEDLLPEKTKFAKGAAGSTGGRAHAASEEDGTSSSSGGLSRRRITQRTFDDAVRENMDEFDMEIGDAIAGAISEFEMQGADLSGIDVRSLA